MKTKLYNQKGQEIGDINLPKEIFEVKLNSDLLHQVISSQMSNRRQGTVQTKDRGEVRGGGKKPWRQKGTGRARHGSRRSPIWIGGGVTFGPTIEKNYKRVIPSKIRKKALFMVLSEKAKDGFVLPIDKLNASKIKTKEIAKDFKGLFLDKGSGMVVLPNMDKNLILSIRNIKKTRAIQAKDLNALDLLNYKYVIMSKESIAVVKETFVK